MALSETSLENLEKELEDLIDKLNNNVAKSTRELGEKSLDYMKKQYMQNNMSSHTGNINLKAYENSYKKGFILSSGDDEVAIYNEFGTGIVGSENPSKLATETGYEYNVPSPYKGVIPEAAYYQHTREYLEAVNTPNTWWYFKNGKWWHTEGTKPKNMYSNLVDELRENAKAYYQTTINQTIGNYGGKK